MPTPRASRRGGWAGAGSAVAVVVSLLVLLLPSVADGLVLPQGSSGQTLVDSWSSSVAGDSALAGELSGSSLVLDLLPDVVLITAGVQTAALIYQDVFGSSPPNLQSTVACVEAGVCAGILGQGCAGVIMGNHGWPDWSGPSMSAGGTVYQYQNWYDLNNVGLSGFQWPDGSTVPCDPALAFPLMYPADAIASEPWQLKFCTTLAVVDGGGYWPPPSVAAAAGTSYSWVNAAELDWINTACPPSWLAGLPGWSSSQVAGAASGPSGGPSGSSWTTSNAECAFNYDDETGAGAGLIVEGVCSGPVITDPSVGPKVVSFGLDAAGTLALESSTSPGTAASVVYNCTWLLAPCALSSALGSPPFASGQTLTLPAETTAGSTTTWEMLAGSTPSAVYNGAPVTVNVDDGSTPLGQAAVVGWSSFVAASADAATVPTLAAPSQVQAGPPNTIPTVTPTTVASGADPTQGQTAATGCSFWDPVCWLEDLFIPSPAAVQELQTATDTATASQWVGTFTALGASLTTAVLGFGGAVASAPGCSGHYSPYFAVAGGKLVLPSTAAESFPGQTAVCSFLADGEAALTSADGPGTTGGPGILPWVKVALTFVVSALALMAMFRYVSFLFQSGK